MYFLACKTHSLQRYLTDDHSLQFPLLSILNFSEQHSSYDYWDDL